MALSMTIDAETSAGTLERMQAAITARAQALGTMTPDNVVAMTINILGSLRASSAKVATGPRAKVSPSAYRIAETNMFGGLYFPKGTKPERLSDILPQGGRRAIMKGAKFCARVGSHYGPRSHIRPAVGFDPKEASVLTARVYAIYTDNPHDTFSKNVNAPALCWYVLCQHIGQAVAFAENHIRPIYSKESGMAKYALAIAQAQASTRSKMTARPNAPQKGGMSSRATMIAFDAANLAINMDETGSGVANVAFFDGLNYSKSAAGGEGAVSDAIDKGINRMVNAYGSPAVREIFTKYRPSENPKAQLLQAFRAHWLVSNSGSDRISRA